LVAVVEVTVEAVEAEEAETVEAVEEEAVVAVAVEELDLPNLKQELNLIDTEEFSLQKEKKNI
jgi:hypothetical protein